MQTIMTSNDRTAGFFDGYASGFDAIYGNKNTLFNRFVNKAFRGVMRERFERTLAGCSPIEGKSVLDIGSGPGIPGLVLALVQPYERVWLVDSNGKKARFLRECVRRFGLTHCSVHEQRSESLRADPGFTQVVSRAYAELADFVRSTRALLAPGGCWLAMKGKYPEAEIARLPADVRLSSSLRLQVPGADGERHLLTLHPTV